MFSKELGHFRGRRDGYAHDAVKDGAVEGRRHLRGLGIETAHYFRNIPPCHGSVARVFALGGKGHVDFLFVRGILAGSLQSELVSFFQIGTMTSSVVPG